MTAEARAIGAVSEELDYELELDGDTLYVGDAELELWPRENKKQWGEELLALREAFPSIAHGDQREKLLYKIIQDASGSEPRILDAQFRESLPDTVPLADQNARQVVAAAIGDEYWTTVKQVPYLVPYHSLLPSSFVHTSASKKLGRNTAARYKLFNSVVLPYLCWAGDGVDTGLVDELLSALSSDEDFTLLDELMLDAARVVADTSSNEVSVGNLTRGQLWEEVESALKVGAFSQAALDQFQADMRTVLSMRAQLPRRDLLDLVTSLLSFALTIHYYRVAVTLGEQLDRAIATTGGLEPPPLSRNGGGELTADALAGRILFRIGTRGDRPVRMTDPCVLRYRELTEHRLMGMPAVIITMNLTQRLWQALGDAPPRADLVALDERAQEDEEFAQAIDAGTAALAVVYAARSARTRGAPELNERELVALGTRRPGLFALREAVIATRRTRLRHTSRDVVNQLAKRESGGSLIRTRGPATFFELDEDFLFLVVKLICQDGEVDFATFLHELTRYGLAPQDEEEKGLLADALERLGMLRRYSDAGESIYVHHPIA